MRYGRVLALALVAVAVIGAPAAAQQAPEAERGAAHPLEPPDTSSPRATLLSFLEGLEGAWRQRLGRGEEGLRVAVRSGARNWTAGGRRAIGCLDLSAVPPGQVDDTSFEAALLLFDAFNRIPLPDWEEIPNAEAAETLPRARWSVPRTPITIALVAEGPRAGEWLFTPDTVNRAREFYRLTRDLPVKPDVVVEDGFQLYISISGWMIPTRVIRSLPPWAHETLLDQTVWQWASLLAVLAITGVLMWVSVRWSRRPGADGVVSNWRAMSAPVAFMLLCAAALYFLDDQLNVTGAALTVLSSILRTLFFLAAALLVSLLARLFADGVAKSTRMHLRPVGKQLLRIGARLLAIVAIGFLAVAWARAQGIPVIGIITGFGVGGLAVALAAQSTVENFIGSLTLFADRPVSVGEFCRFGDQLGVVEHIGMRSTRIRTLQRSVLTVPNAEFSRLQIDNLTVRDKILFRSTLNLRLETTTEQLEGLLAGLRELLLALESVSESPARARLVTIGPLSLDIEVYAYIETRDWSEFLAIREELLLQILGEVAAAGTALAPPAQTNYVRMGEPPASRSPVSDE